MTDVRSFFAGSGRSHLEFRVWMWTLVLLLGIVGCGRSNLADRGTHERSSDAGADGGVDAERIIDAMDVADDARSKDGDNALDTGALRDADDTADGDLDGSTDAGDCPYRERSGGVCTGSEESDGCNPPPEFEETESSCDGLDNDCDGEVDEQCSCTPGETQDCYTGPAGTAGTGICERGTQRCNELGEWDACGGSVEPNSSETCGNGTDDDCDGVVDEGCRCSYDPGGGTTDTGVCEFGTRDDQGTCQPPSSYESDESSCDGKDNDCDGSVDESCRCNPGETRSCYDGPSDTQGVGACSDGTQTCGTDGRWSTCQGSTTPQTESCNGADDDCDGTTDEGCSCNYDPGTGSTSTGVCSDGQIDASGTCQPPDDYESDEVSCDDQDNDCDGTVDEGCDDDGDDFCDESMRTVGTPSVCPDGGGDCDDTDPARNPAASEDCSTSSDLDCDGTAQCGDDDCSSCGSGTLCSGSTCVESACSNGADDDADSDTDCFDSDCSCPSGTSCSNNQCVESACSNGADDDSDGDTDCTDSNCSCPSGSTCSNDRCVETRCTNGADDDGDSDTDCTDSDCSCPSGTTCSNDQCIETACTNGSDDDSDGDIDCSDSDCSCPSGTSCSNNQCVESACSNGADDDGDGDTDCTDSDCSCPAGSTCSNDRCVETRCTNGADDDGDGDVDCTDSDCSCPSGTTCSNDQCIESACSNGTDDDGDGDVDCADSDCDGAQCNGSGTACDSQSSACTETACSDGNDNDGDGDTDCHDSDCSCPSGTTCTAGGCVESACSNGIDDDSDGDTDCQDSNCPEKCAGSSCSSDSECLSGICHDGLCAFRIFVTSTAYRGDLGGLSGADSRCQSRADSAGLGGSWRAIASDSGADAKSRLASTGPIFNLGGAKVADDSQELWAGNGIDSPPEYDENGVKRHDRVWTGTEPDGTADFPWCRDWQSSSSRNSGTYGNSQYQNTDWLKDNSNPPPKQACHKKARLYCLDGQ